MFSSSLNKLVVVAAVVLLSCDSGEEDSGASNDPCKQADQDGVIGGNYTFDLTVTDTEFSPLILKAQNSGVITLKLRNTGSKAHGFSIQCLTVQGCTSCFPAAAKIDAIVAGAEKTVTFTAPEQEGIFTITGGNPDDKFTAQFILQ